MDTQKKYIELVDSKVLVFVPTINDGQRDFQNLIELNYQILRAVKFQIKKRMLKLCEIKVNFNFSKCKFLRQNAIAYLGAISFLLKAKRIVVTYNIKSLQDRVLKMLMDDGFLNHNFQSVITSETVVSENSIEFQRFKGDIGKDPEISSRVFNYVQDEWLKKSDLKFSDSLKTDMTARLFELFANALEHSQSIIGCIACGQTYDETEEVVLTIVDMGVGIADKIKHFIYKEDHLKIDSNEAMKRAFTTGFTTREPQSGGMGLSLLVEFLKVNGGEMDIYCNDINWHVERGSFTSYPLLRYFYGTIVNVRFKQDSNSRYKYKREVD